MRSYGFADGNGYSIARGMQFLSDAEARAWAQKEANCRKVAVDFWDESSPMHEDPTDGREGLETVEPEERYA